MNANTIAFWFCIVHNFNSLLEDAMNLKLERAL